MAILCSCWFIIETVLIPNGSRKWVLLGYYINPILVLICQFFLFGKLIGSSMFVLLCWFTETVLACRYLAVEGFRLMRYSVFQLVVIMELDDASIIRLFNVEGPRQRWFDLLDTERDDEEEDLSRSILLYEPSRVLPVTDSSMVLFGFPSDVGYREEGEVETGNSIDGACFQLVVLSEHDRHRRQEEEEEEQEQEEQEQEDFEDSEAYREEDEEESQEAKDENFEEEEENLQTDGDLDSESSHLDEQTTAIVTISETRREETLTEPKIDGFYKNYIDRMRYFDQRLSYGIYVVKSLLLRDITKLPLPELELIGNRIDSLSNIGKRMILKSHLYDFEMVYVGQLCLSWEVLHHHYGKVRALVYSPGSDRWVFSGEVSARFQRFQVSVQRFTENCSGGGKRFLSYVQSRSSNGNLLQVPNVADYLVEACDHSKNEDVISARELLGIIERTLMIFKDFLEKDKEGKPPLMKFKNFLFVDSQVENPNDLELLATLNKELNKKERMLKELNKGSSRWWRKKRSSSSSLEDEKAMMFSMIETKLVSRVLKMSKISTEQLKWCEGKLNGVKVKKRVVTLTSNGSLFPC